MQRYDDGRINCSINWRDASCVTSLFDILYTNGFCADGMKKGKILSELVLVRIEG